MAMEELDRATFLEQLIRRFEELRADPDAWREIEAERAVEEGALRDQSR
jgi:hypothetical protein